MTSLLAVGISVSVLLLQTEAKAEAESFEVAIPETGAKESIKQLSRQTGYSVIYQSRDIAGIQTNSVTGRYTLQGALNALFAGTQLSGSLTEMQVITILHRSGEPNDRGENMIIASENAGKVAATMLAVFTSQGATGQTAPSGQVESRELKIEEIVVTAQRRERSLQDLAISLHALGEDELQRLGADSLRGFIEFTPGVTLIDRGPVRTQIQMRGVGGGDQREDRIQVGETVGLYLDETPIANQIVNPNLALLDIERIEALRGPQATLYGAGSLSGTIRMISRKANLSQFQASGSVTGSYTENGTGNVEVDGVVNIPLLEDQLALRVVGFYRDLGGYIDNIITGEDNINDQKEIGTRIGMRYVPTEKLSVDAHFMYQKTELGGFFEYHKEDAGDLKTLWSHPTPTDGELMIGSLVGEYDLGIGTLTSATSYFERDATVIYDIGGFTSFLTGIFPTDGFLTPSPLTWKSKDLTQEFRLVSKSDGVLDWIVGGFVQDKSRRFFADLPSPGIDEFIGIDSRDFLVEPDTLFKVISEIETTQVAVFAEVTWRFLERWSFNAGYRWFDYDMDSDVFFGGLFAIPAVGSETFSGGESGINPKYSLSFEIDNDRMVYALVAKGFRLGGTNEPVANVCEAGFSAAGIFPPPPVFDSDSLWNYEVGLKSTWFDRRLRLNVAGYYIDWDSPPVTFTPTPRCGFSTIINAGGYEVTGIEVDMEAVISEGLSVRAGFAYTNSELNEDVPFIEGFKGDPAPYIPEFTASAAVDYEFPLNFVGNNWMGFVHGNVHWVDERLTGFPSQQTSGFGLFKLSDYAIGNLRLGLRSNKWQVELFVENLWDERPEFHKAFANLSEFNGAETSTARPRTFGIKTSLSY